MKRWIIFGVALSVLLACTMAALIGFFFMDIWNTGAEQSAAATDPFRSPAPTTSSDLPSDNSLPPDTLPPTDPGTDPSAPETDPTPPEVTEPEITKPEETEPEETEPEITEPEETEPEETEPEITEPEETEPEETEPEITEPEETEPEETEPVVPDQPDVDISARYAFVYDNTGGEYLFTSGSQTDRIAMASITKLYSAYVALQHMDVNTVITAGKEVNWIDPQSSRAWIYQGQKLSVETCIQGMLIPSGNDAAYVMAVACGRVLLDDPNADARDAFDAFVAEMNTQAQILGLTGSHFANPDGIDDPEHYTTAADVLKIAQLAMQNSTISHCAATATVTAQYASGESSTWQNSNRLLHSKSNYYCPEAIGLKTGHTNDAGYCLLSAFHCQDRILIIGVFGCESTDQRDTDTLALYEAFG